MQASIDPTGEGHSFDLMDAIARACALLAPLAPGETTLAIATDGPLDVRANADEVTRTLFNLLAVSTALAHRLTATPRIRLDAEAAAGTVVVRIGQDDPALLQLAMPQMQPPQHVLALAVARELTERNGGAFEQARSGAAFVVRFPAEMPLYSFDHALDAALVA